MKILLVGYGKMGKAIEQVALERNHEVVGIINTKNKDALATVDASTVDVAIEFSQPQTAYKNIHQCLSQGIPVISGTTGWLEEKEKIEAYCQAKQGTFFYASNFSIGMNIFFKINAFVAKLMNSHHEYEASIEEVHHLEKKDAPSGTAITLAEGMIQNLNHKKSWDLAPVYQEDILAIEALREHGVPGTHTVTYKSLIDTLSFQHVAHSRTGFALGAVLVAEWLRGKQGVLGMQDFLQLDNC